MIDDLLAEAEGRRVRALASLDAHTQDSLGQFFTPARASALIASMPRLPASDQELRVLDPGAGSGMLTAALASRVLAEHPAVSMHVVAVECDEMVLPFLHETLDACKAAGEGKFTFELVAEDFIIASTGLEADPRLSDFDLVIQNPPYAKLAASSPHRQALKRFGVDAPNLYAAFLALATAALRPGGQLVAITPRSFFNGPYFGPFRSFLLHHVALDRVHVFESRSTVFADTGVLQENVIFAGTRDGDREKVTLSISAGHEDNAAHRSVPYAEVVQPNDPHRFIRLATNDEDTKTAELMVSLPCSLADLGVQVSTGRVVDFRSREALLTEARGDAHPLIYPGNLRGGGFVWPREDIRKAQWFAPAAPKDHTLLFPEGWYCVVKRFSAKEERRRIVASVWSPEEVPGPVAFENHVNVLHIKGEGLGESTARGLAVWLNSSFVDRFFRTFSGHTQVNATDLRTLRFPRMGALRRLGELVMPDNQADIDTLVSTVTTVVA